MPRHAWASRLSDKQETAVLCIVLSVSYMTTYFFTRPMFVLPDEYLKTPAIDGSLVDRQSALALAQSLGYFFSKIPAIALMSSSMFFNNRQAVISALYVVTAIFCGVGFIIFDNAPIGQSVAVGLSSLTVGMVYGGMISYAEGRGNTEIVVAALNLCLVLAGGLARVVGTALVNTRMKVQYVPGAACLIGLVVGLFLLDVLAHMPPPSRKDQERRGVRRAMTSEERWTFLKKYALGIFLSLIAYSALTSIRSFRDYFALELYTELNGGQAPAASTYFLADFPGSLAVCCCLAMLSGVKSNRQAAGFMMAFMILGVVILGCGTLLHSHGLIGGMSWQVMSGVGIYTSYLVMGTAFFERLLAASGSEGTIVFLQFISDGCGWLGTIAILFWKNLGTDRHADVSKIFTIMSTWPSIAIFLLLVVMSMYFLWALPKSVEPKMDSLIVNSDHLIEREEAIVYPGTDSQMHRSSRSSDSDLNKIDATPLLRNA